VPAEVTRADRAHTRVAAVDCGTNSLRLLVAEQDGDGGLVDLDRRLEIVRLGQGIDATGEFHADALGRTFEAVERYAEIIRSAKVPVERIHFIATSAARDAGNRESFFAGVQQRLGVQPDVISGDTEARLSFSGALSRIRPAAEPVLVMDIGGGSTELVVGTAAGELSQAVSLDIGSVRLTERFLRPGLGQGTGASGGVPQREDLAAAADQVDAALAASGVDLSSIGSWIGVAGTVTTMAALHLGLPDYDRDKVHGSTIDRAQVGELLERLSRLTVDEIRAVAGMHPQRADVITAGTLIAARVARLVSAPELVVSESDILDGVALQLLRTTTTKGPR
jgi:exopolyphosphatase/guanosine-5'-triphosphate,3'-diphosphate pyrophosphatase